MKAAFKFILLFVLVSQVLSFSLLDSQIVRDDEENTDTEYYESDEDTDDAYDEEDKEKNSTAVVPLEEIEELTKDEIDELKARELLASRLGIKNFSRAALAEKATNTVVSYLQGGIFLPNTPRPKKRVKPKQKPEPLPATPPTKKYSIKKSTTAQPEIITDEAAGNMTGMIRTFVITVPQGTNGTGGGTIEINIPMEMNAGENSEDHHISQMSISSGDDQQVKNIEAAIMEALLIAQQMTSMSVATSQGENNTEILELDISNNLNSSLAVAEINNGTNVTVAEVETRLQPEIEALTTELPFVVQPTKRRRVRSTTTPRGPTKDDPLGVGPVTDMIVSQIRNGKLPSFLWQSILKLSNSRYMQIAVDAVECAVFYYCPDDEELGTLSKGSKF